MLYFLPYLNASGLILLRTSSKEPLCIYMAKPNHKRLRTKLRKLLPSPFRGGRNSSLTEGQPKFGAPKKKV